MPGWSDHILCWLARYGRPRAGQKAGGAVHELTQQAGVAVLAGVFLGQMDANPAQGYLAAAFGDNGVVPRIAGDRQPSFRRASALPGYAGHTVRCWSAGLSGEPAGKAGQVWRYLASGHFRHSPETAR